MLVLLSGDLRFGCALIVLLVMVFAVGCNRDFVHPAKMVDIAGEVYLDDQPLTNARVMFVPEDARTISEFSISYGKTNSKGEFLLETSDEREGAIVGRHRVYISRADFETTQNDIGSEPAEFFRANDTEYRTNNFDEDWVLPGKTIELAAGEDVPFYYNFHSQLICDVIPGRGIQRIRFDLSSVDPLLKTIE